VVPGTKPVILLVKLPLPEPSVVLLFDVVGFAVVAQQTPLEITTPPPPGEITPPLLAEVFVIEVTVVVEMEIVKSSCPYLDKAGLFTILPFLFTKFIPVAVFCPLFVTPCAERG